MKNIRSIILFSLFLFVGAVSLFAGGTQESAGTPQVPQIDDNKLVVYTGKSFLKYGPGKEVAKMFKEKTGIEVDYVIVKEEALDKLIFEGKNTRADIIFSDNFKIERARKSKALRTYHPKNIESKIEANAIIGSDWILTPFEFGYVAFMFDTKSQVKPPKKLSDLTKPEYKNKIVIYDPEMSTTGCALPLWIDAVYKDKSKDFIKEFKKSVIAMTPSWSDGYYSLFTGGEAPFALSYTSSLSAHLLYDKTDRYQPLIFEEGHIVQVMALGISAYSKRVKNAEAFIDFMLTEEVQSLLPEKDFMYPVLKSVKLPKSYKNIPKPKKVLKIKSTGMNKIIKSAKNELQK